MAGGNSVMMAAAGTQSGTPNPTAQAQQQAGRASLLMGTAEGIQGLSSMGNAFSQSQAIQAQAAFQKQQYDTNATLADMQSQDAINRGDKQAQLIKTKTSQMISSQRAAMGAQGVEVNSGSNMQIQEDTASIGALDALTAKNNAWREAWGYKMQASQYRGAGAMASLAADNESRNTLLTGGMQMLGYGLKSAYYTGGGDTLRKG